MNRYQNIQSQEVGYQIILLPKGDLCVAQAFEAHLQYFEFDRIGSLRVVLWFRGHSQQYLFEDLQMKKL